MWCRIVSCYESLGEERLGTNGVSRTRFPFETPFSMSVEPHESDSTVEALIQQVGLGEPLEKAT